MEQGIKSVAAINTTLDDRFSSEIVLNSWYRLFTDGLENLTIRKFFFNAPLLIPTNSNTNAPTAVTYSSLRRSTIGLRVHLGL